MNILIDNLPQEINGIPIDTDYRRMIQFELLMMDGEIPSSAKLQLAINLLYKEPVPDDLNVWDGLLWFYRCGMEVDQPEDKHVGPSKKVYDFDQDASDIYASFWQVYRIDLQETPLHWWSFMSLLSALPETCPMGRIMMYRSMDTSRLKGTEKKRIQEIQRKFAIKRKENHKKLTLEERNTAFLSKVKQRQKEAEIWIKQKNK